MNFLGLETGAMLKPIEKIKELSKRLVKPIIGYCTFKFKCGQQPRPKERGLY